MCSMILQYARRLHLPVREEEHAYVILLAKEPYQFEVTVLKDDKVLEWFVSASDTQTGMDVWHDYGEHWVSGAESRQTAARELEETVVWFLDLLHSHEVRVVKQPLFHLFGRPFGASLVLEIRRANGWCDIFAPKSSFPAQ